MELESYEDGTLLYIGVEEKASVPVDGIIAIIGEKGEKYDDLLADVTAPAAAEPSAPANESAPAPVAVAEKIDTSGINATVIKMPKMSDTMTEGVIASWLKKVGDDVKSGDILAEVETDKATMELESYDDGVLLYTAIEAGGSVPVDGVIAIIGEKGADFETLLKAEQQAQSAPAEAAAPAAQVEAPAAAPSPAPASAPSTPAVSTSSNGRVIASPLAKKLAKEKGYDIAQIPGDG